MWDFYITNREGKTIIQILEWFFGILKPESQKISGGEWTPSVGAFSAIYTSSEWSRWKLRGWYKGAKQYNARKFESTSRITEQDDESSNIPEESNTEMLAFREGVVIRNWKPEEARLRVYGCKAFAMTPDAQLKRNRLQRFDPRAWIGYLVGYESTNIFRIWVPRLNRVIWTRDVTFNEDKVNA